MFKIEADGLRNLAIGDDFGLVVDSQGALYGWGANTNGELGTGD